MAEPTISVHIDEDDARIRVYLDLDTYRTLENHAAAANMTIEAFAKKIIEDGMKREMKQSGIRCH